MQSSLCYWTFTDFYNRGPWYFLGQYVDYLFEPEIDLHAWVL